VDKLQQHYGAPVPPPSTDPLELIIWENIAYLASDKRRAEAFATLKQTIGTRPEQILAAKHSALAAIGKAGILPDVSAEKLLAIAKIAYEEFDSDLRPVLKKPLLQAKQKEGYGNLMLTPEQQAEFVRELPEVFLPIHGGWGRMGMTHIRLAQANEDVLVGALRAAWMLRREKNAGTRKKRASKAGRL
jgi:hypothetical protein